MSSTERSETEKISLLKDLVGKDVLVVTTLPPGSGRVIAANKNSRGHVWLEVEYEDGTVKHYGLNDILTL